MRTNFGLGQWREPERFVLMLTGVGLLLNAVLLLRGTLALDWQGYAVVALAAIGIGAVGQFYRISRRSDRLGDALIVTSLWIAFPAVFVIFNYLQMPVANAPIDAQLMWVDSLYGYEWTAWIEWAAYNPFATNVLRFAYTTFMPQVLLLVLVLSLTGRQATLDRMLVTMVVTSIIAVCFWSLFPTHGAKAYATLSPAVEMAANPVVTTEYGRELLRMAAEGAGYLSPSDVKGLIALPSYHAVIACYIARAAWDVPYLRWPLLTLSLLTLPACMVHGGHHLIDVPAGIVVFLVGDWMARRVIANKPVAVGQVTA